jgi:segregation and condensation protein B
MSNLKYKLEALLFSSARSMKIEELSNLAKASPEEVRETLNELKKDYEERDSSIALIDEGNSFKLNVKSEHAPMVNQVVTETELSKTLMETLAVIAFKYPIKQSELIKIRTNKAYDHLRELDEMGYIIRQKFGRTKLIKLTPKFFEYFDLPQEKLKEKFQDFGGIARAIKEKEEEIKQIKDDMKKKAKEEGKNKEQEGEPEVDLIDKEGNKEKLEVYEKTESEQEVEESKEVKPYVEKVGDLEVADVPEKEESEEDVEKDTEEDTEGIEMTESMGKEVIEKIKADITGEKPEEKPEEEKTSKEVESEVDKKVDELLHPKETEEEPAEETNQEEPESQSEQQETPKEPAEETNEETSKEPPEEEPKDLLEAAEEEEKKE